MKACILYAAMGAVLLGMLAVTAAQAQTRPSLDGLQAHIHELKALMPVYKDATGRTIGVAVTGGVLVRVGSERYVLPLDPAAVVEGSDTWLASTRPARIQFQGRDCQGGPYVRAPESAQVDAPRVPPPGARGAHVLNDPAGLHRVYVESAGTPALLEMGSYWDTDRALCNNHSGRILPGLYLPLSLAAWLSDILVEPLTLK